MISYEQALDLLNGLKSGLNSEWGTEHLPLADCLGRVLAKPLLAKLPSPPFTNAAMDGFAVRAETVRTATPLRVTGTIYAGAQDAAQMRAPGPDSCVRIMTGAPLPDWADAVIPVEQSKQEAGGIVLLEAAAPGDHVRHVGEDIANGSVVLAEKCLFTPETLMIAAAFGHEKVEVFAQPRVVIISTGDELKEPGATLRPGEIYNSSRYFLAAAAASAGLKNISSLCVSDLPDLAASAIAAVIDDTKSAQGPALIVTTGAVSAGEKDFIPDLARRLGFETLFHKVSIRPGKPVFAARKGRHVWLGLPGNPISTAATWHYFGRPLLAAWANIPQPQKIAMTLAADVRKPEGLRSFFRARHEKGLAIVHKGQGSAHFQASTTANAYVELPENGSLVPSGTIVEGILIG